MTNQEEIINRVKLLMSYTNKKTLSENLMSILEQIPDDRFSPKSYEKSFKESNTDENEEKFKYPNYCSRPDKAILPSENSIGLSGEDALIDGFCYYPSAIPKTNNGKTGGIYIPQDAKINFVDNSDIDEYVKIIMEKYPNEDKDIVKKSIQSSLPLGVVEGFILANGETYGASNQSEGNSIWFFGGYFSPEMKPYVQPNWVDKRNEYQKLVDNWGTTAQIVGALATVAAGLATGGAAWILPLEVFIEGSLGMIVGLREVEKGRNIAAGLSFVTGFLPMLKYSKYFRGINKKYFKSLSEKLKNSNLTLDSTPQEITQFYKTLSPDEQKIMTQLLTTDERTKFELIDELSSLDKRLPEMIFDELGTVLKNNPSFFVNLSLKDKLWVRELTSNVFAVIVSLGLEVFLGEKLNAQDIEKLDGVYSITPSELKQEVAYNYFKLSSEQPEKLKQIIKSPEFDSLLTKKSKEFVDVEKQGESWSNWFKSKHKQIFDKNGVKYIELNVATTQTTQDLSSIENKLRQDGFKPKTELPQDIEYVDVKYVNGVVWVKPE